MANEIPEPPENLIAMTNNRFERDRLRTVWRMGYVEGREAAAQEIEDYAARLDARPRNAFNELRKAAHFARGSVVPQEVPTKEPCEGFYWIGQPFTSCDNCGQPAWEHKGTMDLASGSPFGGLKLRSWKDGEAEAIRRKWDPRYRSAVPQKGMRPGDRYGRGGEGERPGRYDD